ncbi:MAG: hypothetical protein U0795_24900 [Pirellulales bacterium]
MTICPRCEHEMSRPVAAEGMYPRFRACSWCGFPLVFDQLWHRVEQGSGTDAAVGSLFGPGLRTLTYDGALNALRRDFHYGVDAFAEYESAILFRVMDQIYIFNFGPAGDCFRYWDSGNESAGEG